MNYMEQVAKMLGVRLEEEFKLNDNIADEILKDYPEIGISKITN